MRKLIVFIAIAVCGALSAKDIYVSTSFHEPANEGLRFIYSKDGIHWDSIQGTFLKPTVGKEKVMRDPSIVRGPDGIFHLVWTCSWKGDRGFGYSSSKDLIHWTTPRHIDAMSDTTTVNVWAPELFYDDVKNQYLIIWASCVPGKFPDYQEEHRNNHRLYYKTTKDFVHFSKEKLFYDPDYSDIDATLVKKGKDNYVMVVKDNSRPMRNIKVAFAKTPYGPWSASSEPFTEQFTEGPSTAKVGEWYYIYYDTYRKGTYGAHRTKDFKTFQNRTDEVSFPKGHKHGTVFMTSEEIVEGLIKYNRDVVHYTGSTIATPARHDGGLKPVVGVHNIQIMRGEKPWTYNHQPMMAYWNGRFYVHYLTNPRNEHEAPGRTMLTTSADGYTWTEPTILFPEYNIPDGVTKPTYPNIVSKDLKAVMHQRVGFYVSKNGRLIATGNYGIVLAPKDDPNDGNGIGRVVREIKKDGSFGPIYFIYYNHGFNEKNTSYPYYKKSKDKGFIKAVDEILDDPMQRMQWVEEADRDDDILPLTAPYKAFCGYTLPDGRKVALWKHAVTSLSADGGNTWRYPCNRAPGFVNSNAKIWGQRLLDGNYATVYNPAEYRWPLAISLSKDGLEYNTLSLVHGDVTPERHGGLYKSYGPQYVRGIQEGNGIPDDGNLWVTYSHNKEDIWVSRIPVPVQLDATSHATKTFSAYSSLKSMTDWNIYSPLKAPVRLEDNWIHLSDRDPYDYAKIERVIPATKELIVEFDFCASQHDRGELDIEFLDAKGNVASRLVADSAGNILAKGGARYGTVLKGYKTAKIYHVKAILSTTIHRAYYYIDGKLKCQRQFDTPVEALCRVQFRTGALFDKPCIETPADQFYDEPRADEEDKEATFSIANITTKDILYTLAVLDEDDLSSYVDYFNNMEPELFETYIPNSQAEYWMKGNIPYFDCPQENFKQIYYFRWWSFRKHIVKTPYGYGITEFSIKRSYSDKFNLIACALGHHIMEGRWLRNQNYLRGNLQTWYFGNEGKPLSKMEKFTSWNPAAVFDMWKVTGDTTYLKSLLPSLEAEYTKWQDTHLLENGLYWQEDVRDGMEESISGGRKKHYARPTINSYMYGNAKALAEINFLLGNNDKATFYQHQAKEQKHRVEKMLWNAEHNFFETLRGDTSAAVREEIGFIPWYFNLPESEKYDEAWKQIEDEKGFSAPFGLTTAERRHPQFRSHGVGTCEWDGAVWPFATSQTLTALANYINDYPSPIIGDSTYFRQMELYVESQYKRGRPYIGEYLDEKTGAWLMGDRERSYYYNHSTFADLIITGLVGLRPQADGSIVVRPLLPKDKWDYFCLDGVPYRGHSLTILWDKDGSHYHHGKGLQLLVDGEKRAWSLTLDKIKASL